MRFCVNCCILFGFLCNFLDLFYSFMNLFGSVLEMFLIESCFELINIVLKKNFILINCRVD